MSEIEKQFMETFDIPKIFKTTINIGDLDMNYQEIQAPTLEELYEKAQYDFDTPIYFSWFKRSKRWSEEYAKITDRILLELICTLNKSRLVPAVNLSDFNYEDLKNTVLRKNITILKNEFLNNEIRNDFKHQVQALFKENN